MLFIVLRQHMGAVTEVNREHTESGKLVCRLMFEPGTSCRTLGRQYRVFQTAVIGVAARTACGRAVGIFLCVIRLNGESDWLLVLQAGSPLHGGRRFTIRDSPVRNKPYHHTGQTAAEHLVEFQARPNLTH